MKKIIEEAAAKNKLQTAYAGSSRTMYLKGDEETIREFIKQSRVNYPGLAFLLKNGNGQKDFDHIAQKDVKGAPSLAVYSGNGVDEELAQRITKEAHETLVEKTNDIVEEKSGSKKKPTAEEVDIYLLANPVDRKAKGPYNSAAAHFGVKPDYIRGRWARLRELGKVENELQTEKA